MTSDQEERQVKALEGIRVALDRAIAPVDFETRIASMQQLTAQIASERDRVLIENTDLKKQLAEAKPLEIGGKPAGG